jgi:hypothetical protein
MNPINHLVVKKPNALVKYHAAFTVNGLHDEWTLAVLTAPMCSASFAPTTQDIDMHGILR